MELDDCAFPLLAGTVATDDAYKAFEGVDHALLVGSVPRKEGMERSDLLKINGGIFTTQGQALAAGAADDVRILVVGNPANTNCLIAMNNAKGIDHSRFTAMTRLDHNRAIAQLAQKLGVAVTDVSRMTIWGNHSATQFPDLYHALVNGKSAYELVGDHAWYEKEFIPTVQQRGAAVIKARGSSSAASAANAAIAHVRDWVMGSADGDWLSMGVCADGCYGADEGLICSYPVTTNNGTWSIVPDLELDAFASARLDATIAELRDERDAVRELGLIE